jgi:phosphoglycolate phosphatase-like HAD superfamily hydrolase
MPVNIQRKTLFMALIIFDEEFVKMEGNNQCFMAGDSQSDILASKDASFNGVAVTWGHQSMDNLF